MGCCLRLLGSGLFSLHHFGPEVLGVLFLGWEGELTLDTFLGFGLLEFDDELTGCKALPPELPLILTHVFKLLELLKRLLIDQLSEGCFLHHFERCKLVLVQEFLPVLCLIFCFDLRFLASLDFAAIFSIVLRGCPARQERVKARV